MSLCLAAACFFTLLFPGGSSGNEDPIWAYDFRETFYDLAFLNKLDAVIVGARGHVLVTHRKYKNLWSPRQSGTKELLTCVSFIDDTHGWAAGHGGTIIHTADGGHVWEIQRDSSPQNQPLLDIQIVSPTVGYACGAYSTFLKTADGGKTWTEISTGFDSNYNGLAFLDADTGYLVGEFGTVIRTRDGAISWEQLDLGGYQGSLFGITLVTAQKIIVYGIAGKVLRSDDGGRAWEDVTPGVPQSLFRGAVSGNDVVLVGGSGTILYSRDGGRTFAERNDKDLTTFAGVCPHPEGGFLCVGTTGKIFRITASDTP
jgi:photosystem II stability/assembly factor-like uncharacterized protein